MELTAQTSSPEEESLTQDVDVTPNSKNQSRKETTTEEEEETKEEQPCCCSVFKRKMSTIASYTKSFFIAISIMGLVKSLVSLIIFIYDMASK